MPAGGADKPWSRPLWWPLTCSLIYALKLCVGCSSPASWQQLLKVCAVACASAALACACAGALPYGRGPGSPAVRGCPAAGVRHVLPQHGPVCTHTRHAQGASRAGEKCVWLWLHSPPSRCMLPLANWSNCPVRGWCCSRTQPSGSSLCWRGGSVPHRDVLNQASWRPVQLWHSRPHCLLVSCL